MTSPPALFDADLLARRRARAARAGFADFLHLAVAGEIRERLAEITRSFSAPAVVGPQAELWAEALGMPAARAVPDSEVLALDEAAHDLVVHGLALHWANDPVGQLVQARRALRPDGLMIAALFGGETLAGLRAALAEAEIATLGGLSPRVAPMGEVRDLGGLLQRAGFALPVADSQPFDVSYPSLVALMRDLRAMGETNVMRDRLRRPMRRDDAGARRRALRRALRRRRGPGAGALRGDLPDRLGAGPGPAAAAPARLGEGAARRRASRAGTLRETHERDRHDPPAPARAARPRRTRPPGLPTARIGVVLANLGTPDATDYWSMRRYLDEFLSDRRVIDYPRWLWQPLLQARDPDAGGRSARAPTTARSGTGKPTRARS